VVCIKQVTQLLWINVADIGTERQIQMKFTLNKKYFKALGVSNVIQTAKEDTNYIVLSCNEHLLNLSYVKNLSSYQSGNRLSIIMEFWENCF
jgi:hypothetical protein